MRLILILAALAVALPVFADNHMDPDADLADAWYIVVKDGHHEEFEAAFKDHLKYRKKKRDPRPWKTYAPIIGSDLNHYVIRHCCVSWADMDSYREWAQKAKTGDHWDENVDPHVAKYKHYMHKIDFENNSWPEDDPGYQLFGVTRWKIKQGHGGKVDEIKKMFSDHAKEGGWSRSWAWSSQIGGGDMMSLVTPYMNYADIKGPAGGFGKFLAGRIGEEATSKAFADFGMNFHGSSYTVYRLVEDMSMKE
ncbi:MAG: hypothetical protein KJO54_01265 [Gammaproteobacteria bacterium]|nr:hypothetical protein [Gammaproteobacteria bacterium]NNF60496.1 hypothetical protein [Gammaproteobacteria bacterium]NNM20155.1 hypothetical protein [Gammaproteobacteria bacterium]